MDRVHDRDKHISLFRRLTFVDLDSRHPAVFPRSRFVIGERRTERKAGKAGGEKK